MKTNLLGLGIQIAVIVALPLIVLLLAGIALDRKLGTMPIFMIVGILIAMTASSAMLYKKLKNEIQSLS